MPAWDDAAFGNFRLAVEQEQQQGRREARKKGAHRSTNFGTRNRCPETFQRREGVFIEDWPM